MTTVATGNGAAETAPTAPGSLPVKVGNFTANIQTYKGDVKDLVIPVTCVLNAGQDATVWTVRQFLPLS